MTPDELRALADALEPMAKAPCFDGIDIARAAAYLRAQADAKPVGYVTANGMRMLIQDEATVMLYRHDYLIRPDQVPVYTRPAPAVPAGWKLVPVEPTQEMLIKADDAYVRGYSGTATAHPASVYKAMLAAAPAAPQAEPCIGNDPACPCQDGDACHYKDGADGTKAWSVPQAEPKREPLSDGQVTDLWSWASGQDQGPETTQQHAFARAVERAHGIGSDE